MTRPTVSVLTALALGAAAVVTTSGPASAATSYCSAKYAYYCTSVTAIDAGSYLEQHKGPSYGSGSSGHTRLHNGDRLNLMCWTTGGGDADGHGDHYWFLSQIFTNAYHDRGELGYVNDWYVNTGAASTWKQRISHC